MIVLLNKVIDIFICYFCFFDFVLVVICILIVCFNIIGVGKVVEIVGFIFGVGVIFFFLFYVLGDVFIEVYGY